MNLADKMRQDCDNKFNAIKDELTNIVVKHIQEFGYARVFTYTSEREVKENWQGIWTDKAYRTAIKTHYENLGFVVQTRYIGGSSQISGYDIML